MTATYSDPRGHSYSTRSNTVIATVAEIAAITVSPKEAKPDTGTETVPAGQPATRTFLVTNGSNIEDAYRVTALAAGSLTITSEKWVLADGSTKDASGGAISPAVAAGSSISLAVTVATSGLATGTQVPVDVTVQTTATGTVNGLQSDTGREWIVGGSAPSLTGPGGNAQISKSVDKAAVVQSEPGATVTFDVVAVNSGGSPAQNVVVTDNVPPQLTIDLSTVKIDGQAAGSAASVQGQLLTVNVGTLAAGATLDVSFNAGVPPGQTLGASYVNVAGVSANGLPLQQTTPASVFLGLADMVFDGYAGSNHPIGGATIELLDQNGDPVKLGAPAQTSTVKIHALEQGGTANPVVTGADGTYGFALSPSQIAPGGSRFYLSIDAPGYLNRKIELDITPGTEDELYNVQAVSKDGQPLATAGGFTLTNNAVQLQNIFGLFGNLPLFQTSPISVTKTSDRQSAQPGDRIVYTVQFTNTSSIALSNVTVHDVLPPGLVYASGSARLDGSASFEPAVNGRMLTWQIPALAAGAEHTITYATVVFPSTASGTTLTNTVDVSGSAGPGLTESGSANTSVIVTAGMFEDRRVVTGRVFVDARGTGHFTKGDRGVAGVRVYLEDGSFAITDANGLFSFPSVRPGMHVLRIDPATLPPDVRLYDDARMNSTRASQRLLHGILDGATMEDVEFALQGGAK